jgi:hypothetical protein
VKNGLKWLWVLGAVLVLAGLVRFSDLSRSAVRSDEISFLFRTMQNQSLVELWKTPPWFNQIPLADSVPVVWARLTGQIESANEGSLRQPFALIGWLTVAFCCGWVIRRRGLGAGLLMGVWLAIIPLHVYHSREAYYYVLVMCFASGMTLRGADFIVRLKETGRIPARAYAEWSVWALLACLSHMSVWVVAAMTGLLLAVSGWSALSAAQRKRHALGMGLVALAVGGGMIRWVLRALYEMKRAAADPSAHIGSAFDWVGPRVIPFFMGGANVFGVAILLGVLLAAGTVFWKSRGRPGREDPLYGAVMWIAGCGILASYTYIFFVGGGDKAKLAYFLSNFPIFLVWASMSLDKAFSLAGPRRQFWMDAGVALLLFAVLVFPTGKVMQLEGKTTAYRPIRAWLDSELSPGDTVIIDRWLEPWNEMALYAPSNVTVSFTVPDDPYENYVNHQWRKVTRDLFEQNGAQAFIRIARNQEKRIGLWTWPERWFHHRAAVTNVAGLWLRDTGFAPMEEFYSETNRVVTEIFYDTHEEIAERARKNGQSFVWFFEPGWRLFKPWRQGDFSDYRILEQQADLTVVNLHAEPLRVRGEVVAAASGGNPVIQIGAGAPLTFSANQLTTKPFELNLQPGPNTVPWKQLNQSGVLLVRELRLAPAQ